MNKKIIIGGLAILSMTAILGQQANASSDDNSNEKTKMEQMKKGLRLGSGSHTGLYLGSGSHTGLHLGSGMKIRSGEKMRSGKKEHMDDDDDDRKYYGSGNMTRSGNREHMDDDDRKYYGSGNMTRSGKKEHMDDDDRKYYGSGSTTGTGINKNMDKKIKKLDYVFKKMADDKLTLLLTQINTLTTNITDPTLLSIINSIKTMIQNNIGN